MAFDPSKPVRTRGGKPARVICTDRKGLAPIVSLVMDSLGGAESAYVQKADGTHPNSAQFDLVNIPEKIEGWIGLYRLADTGDFLASFARYRDHLSLTGKPTACIKISFEEGEGL